MRVRVHRPDFIVLFLLLCLSAQACAPLTQRFGRTLICETDSVYRRQRGTYGGQIDGALVQVLLFEPRHATRRVATILGYQDANRSEEQLWQSLRVRAAELGATGIRLLDRRITECRAPAQIVTSANANAYWSSATSDAVGPRTFECVQIYVEALVWLEDRTCKEEQDCRDWRNDAFAMNAKQIPSSRLEHDPLSEECGLRVGVPPTRAAPSPAGATLPEGEETGSEQNEPGP